MEGNFSVCVHVRAFVCGVYMCVHVCMCACACVHVHVCMCTCACVTRLLTTICTQTAMHAFAIGKFNMLVVTVII